MKSPLTQILIIALATPVVMAVTTDDGFKAGSSNTVAASSNSIAAGTDNTASDSSITVGTGNEATYRSVAIGEYNYGWGYNSSVFGFGSVVDAYCHSSSIMGQYTGISRSEGVVALGDSQSIDFEQGSLVAGIGNQITTSVNQAGAGNVLLGMNNTLNKGTISSGVLYGTVLLGSANQATGSTAWAIGEGNIAQTGTVTLGVYAQTVSNAALIVANGSNVGTPTRSNALVVLKDGTVQIPSGNLQLGSESALTPTSAGTYLSSHNYLTRSYGTDSSLTLGALLAIGGSASANGTNAVAIGQDSSATSYALALGDNATASGGGAVALGPGSNAWGGTSVAIGNVSYAFGVGSVALGTNTFSNGLEALALAGGNASGDNAFAAIYGHADGYASIGMVGATASNTASIAIGGLDTVTTNANLASGDNATAIGGYVSTASGDYSFTTGYQTKSAAAYSAVLGSNNLSASGTTLTPAHSYGWLGTEALFELGNGNPDITPTQYSNAITTLKNGQTTLTNKFWSSTSPEDVPSATGSSDGEALVVEGHTVLKGNTKLSGKVTMEEPQGDISMGIYE